MLVQLGAPPPAVEVLDRMLECHERIRRFARLAVQLSDAGAGAPSDAERVQTYFSTAFVLHARDEDESLFPLLRGRDEQLDAALDQLIAEHTPLEQLALEVAAIAGLLAIAPDRWADIAPAMRKPARELVEATESHLTLEERVVFPSAKELLTQAERDRLDQQVRIRRAN